MAWYSWCMKSRYFRSPVTLESRAQTGGAMKRASHQPQRLWESVSFPQVREPVFGLARIQSKCSWVGVSMRLEFGASLDSW